MTTDARHTASSLTYTDSGYRSCIYGLTASCGNEALEPAGLALVSVLVSFMFVHRVR
jgi:hypothetical protein